VVRGGAFGDAGALVGGRRTIDVMTSRRYLHYDVFTDRALQGNQLAVFTDGSSMDARLMQAIAREMGFSESTFILAKEDPSTDVRMRIFTPARELPMAGHPTIGSTFALAHTGVIRPGQERFVFGLGIGPTPVDMEWADGHLDFAWMHQQRPQFEAPMAETHELAAVLGLPPAELERAGLPVQVVSCGLRYLLIPLASREAVDAVQVDPGAMMAFQGRAGLEGMGFLVFALAVKAGRAEAYSRMFAPEVGVVEDPATGSAAGPLGCYAVHHGLAPGGRIVNRQGVKMGRPSELHIAIIQDGNEIVDVKVGGHAVLVAEGNFFLQPS
jgi:trans-2,3-dihydro-3-hydroxyanthranilate isomerase